MAAGKAEMADVMAAAWTMIARLLADISGLVKPVMSAWVRMAGSLVMYMNANMVERLERNGYLWSGRNWDETPYRQVGDPHCVPDEEQKDMLVAGFPDEVQRSSPVTRSF